MAKIPKDWLTERAGNRPTAEHRGLPETVGLRIRREWDKLRAELHKEIAALRGDMGNLAWKVAGLLVAQAAVIIALLRLLPGGTP